MRYSIRTVGPIGEEEAIAAVVSLAAAKAHLRVDFDADDTLITAYVAAAQDHVERHTSQVLTPRVMEMAVSGFPCSGSDAGLVIPREPVTLISAIAYTDGEGVDVDLDEEAWRWSESAPGLVLPAWAISWPSAADEAGSVRVTFEAGYETGLVPASLVQAVKMMTAHLYGNREAVVTNVSAAEMPIGVASLCAPYRRISI